LKRNTNLEAVYCDLLGEDTLNVSRLEFPDEQRNPLTEEDVKIVMANNSVAFLCSNKASFKTGQIVCVNVGIVCFK
jgi:hypothetical protein